ncbi:MAG: hypothetical protein HYX74_12405 [Acidobacteria bacterium]|nr:hypothetical protein [Acidobacteriota bacterium]
MRRVLVLATALTLLSGVAHLSAQTLPTPDSALASVIAKYSGASIQLATNSRVTGTITYPGGSSRPFTLTVKKRFVRFDTSTRTAPLSVIWQDLRSQQIHDGKRGFADHGSFANSQVNLAPIVAPISIPTAPL